MKPSTFATLSAVAVLTAAAVAEERIDQHVIAQMKMEGFQRSQVMQTLATLTDVHGPRLTNSPGYKAAAAWARGQLTAWGLANARLEPWGVFGPGWSVERFSVEMTAPAYDRLIAFPQAWTPGTQGVVRGSPVLVELAEKEDFAKYRGTLQGAIVLLGKAPESGPRFEPPATRLSEDDLGRQEGSLVPGKPESYLAEGEAWKKETDKAREQMQFLKDEGIAVLLEPSVRGEGVLEVAAPGYFLGTEPLFPAFVIAREQYGRIVRLLERKVPVTLEISATTRFHGEDTQGYNVLAEIPGADATVADELVMIGAHLDSWHSGTGAVDNAAGCAAVLEAIRILKAIGVRPRRTIRIALWGGEEQGYFGSTGYVRQHFGDPETVTLKPEQAKVSAYFNFDNGSGRIRGVYLQGNEAVRPIFEAFLAPFQYLEATTLTVQNTGGTDHMLFNAVGIPGFQFVQDPLDYDSRRHHANIDVREAVIEDDLRQAAVIMASFLYHTAMRDDLLPRAPLPAPRAAPK